MSFFNGIFLIWIENAHMNEAVASSSEAAKKTRLDDHDISLDDEFHHLEEEDG